MNLFVSSELTSEQSIYHKNLMPVVYVTGDVAGAEESPVYAILKLNQAIEQIKVAGRLWSGTLCSQSAVQF